MSFTKEWWISHVKEVNDVLIGANYLVPKRLVDEGIGNVPLSNLIDVPQDVDFLELADLISHEGIPAIAIKTSESKSTNDVFLKL